MRYCSTKNEVLLFASKDKTTYSSVRQLIDKPEKPNVALRKSTKFLQNGTIKITVLVQHFLIGSGCLPFFFRFYFQTGFYGLAFTKTGKLSLRNCLLSSHETLS